MFLIYLLSSAMLFFSGLIGISYCLGWCKCVLLWGDNRGRSFKDLLVCVLYESAKNPASEQFHHSGEVYWSVGSCTKASEEAF